MSAERTRVYTDGACSGNPGPGGWAWVVPNGAWSAGPASHTTNQRMELEAVLEAIRDLPAPLHVVSDSTYVVNCFRDGWWKGWIKRGWKNTAKKPVANRDLWEPLIALYQETDVTFEWIKGHSGDEWNDVADRLAVEAATTQRHLHGEGKPDLLGPADVVAGAPATRAEGAEASRGSPDPTGRAAPEGRLVAIGGHRPPAIGGYDPNPTARSVRRRLEEILTAKLALHPDLVVLSGLGLGVEQIAAEAAYAVGVPYVAILAFPDPSAVWPKASQEHFDELLDRADDVIVLQSKVPETKARVAGALRRRDAWLARNADEAIVVWDRSDRGIGSFVRTLEAGVGDDVWILDPTEL